MIKKIKKFIKKLFDNSFEDYRYMKRCNLEVIDGVSFSPEHKCYTGFTGIAEFPGENVRLMKALEDNGVEGTYIAHDFININDLSSEKYEELLSSDKHIFNERANVFEVVEKWLVYFKDEKSIKLISQ